MPGMPGFESFSVWLGNAVLAVFLMSNREWWEAPPPPNQKMRY